jgi:hypothetical protein
MLRDLEVIMTISNYEGYVRGYDSVLSGRLFFIVSWGRVRLSPLAQQPLIDLLYQTRKEPG